MIEDTTTPVEHTTAPLVEPEPTINIGGNRRKRVFVRLVGVDYQVLPLKSAVVLETVKRFQQTTGARDTDAELQTLYGWIGSVFEENAQAVRARLVDPADDLDISHVNDLISALMQLGVNPTRS